jgi:hypothetical protein
MSVTQMTASIEDTYQLVKDTPSNINEHIETLAAYAEKCSSIVELGCSDMVTCWAFMKGLKSNKKKKKMLTCVDQRDAPSKFAAIKSIAEDNKITMEFKQGNSMTLDIGKTDMLFIDTWHYYIQLKKELNQHHSNVKKYIILHNTDVDGEFGECVRMCYHFDMGETEDGIFVKDLATGITHTHQGYTIKDVCTGLQKAIDEFTKEHPEWKVEKVFDNNHGLVVLSRMSQDTQGDD